MAARNNTKPSPKSSKQSKKQVRDLNRKAAQLERKLAKQPKSSWRQTADEIWGLITEITGDIMSGGKDLLSLLGLSVSDLLPLLAL
jgi:hypothetical protein